MPSLVEIGPVVSIFKKKGQVILLAIGDTNARTSNFDDF